MEIELAYSNKDHCQIRDFIDELPKEERAHVYSAFNHIEKFGLDGLDTRQIQGKIWEFKTYRFNRFFYFIKTSDKMIIIYAMRKTKE
jgi:phage-related protein